jgi:uncharacterized protein YbbC (DUF1343 family)
MPLRHCCTLGELALYFAATRVPSLHLNVIPVGGYLRHQTAPRDFDFVPTSPAIQTAEAAQLYPGLGLLEGVNINEGRGTLNPFTCCGAPFINASELLEIWQQRNIPGIKTDICTYVPGSGIYAGQTCFGLQFNIIDKQALRPVGLGVTLLQTLMALYPQQVTERLYPTAANPMGSGHLDKLLGIPRAFDTLQQSTPITLDVNPYWQETMRPYLLY